MTASPKAVCVSCRKVYKGNTERVVMTDQKARERKRVWPLAWQGTGAGMHTLPPHCPECHGPLARVWYGWRPPKRGNGRAWKRIAAGDWLWEREPRRGGRMKVGWLGRPTEDRTSPGQRKREKALTPPTWRRG